MLSFFPRGVLDEILNLIESVSEGFSFLLLVYNFRKIIGKNDFSYHFKKIIIVIKRLVIT